MAENNMICHCFQVDYITIRKAMIAGARTVEDVAQATSATLGCGGCKTAVQEILDSVCGCKGVSMATVKQAITDGATTVEEINNTTQAGTGCGRCNALIESVLKDEK